MKKSFYKKVYVKKNGLRLFIVLLLSFFYMNHLNIIWNSLKNFIENSLPLFCRNYKLITNYIHFSIVFLIIYKRRIVGDIKIIKYWDEKKQQKKTNRMVKVKNNLLELEKDFKELRHGELKDK